jgi:hypothetical protein
MMSAEREVLVTVLKLTKAGPIESSLVGRDARIPSKASESLLKKIAEAGLVNRKGEILEASPDQRVGMAVQALRLGADFERVCGLLEWREFENITTTAFEIYDYRVVKNLRFKETSGKRWEIDLLACKQPQIVSVDCKHWRHNWTRAPIITAVEQHVARTKALAEALPNLYTKIGLDGWKHAIVVPIVLSFLPSLFKFHHGTPIVPVLKLQSFLNEIPAHVGSLTCFLQKTTKVNREITEY